MSTTDPDIAIIETSSLGDRSYLISHDGIAVVIDPQRDIDRVRALAAEKNAVITHVLETHIHNDYVTGGLELARARVPNTSSRTAIRSNTSAEQSSTAMSSTRDRRRSRSCTPQGILITTSVTFCTGAASRSQSSPAAPCSTGPPGALTCSAPSTLMN